MLFSEQGSATLFAQIPVSSVGPLPEKIALAQKFFPARDMDWNNDCPTGIPTDPNCFISSFQETNATFLLRSAGDILVVPDVNVFNTNQYGNTSAMPPILPVGSSDFTLVTQHLEQSQSFPRDFLVSGRYYNATWFLRSPGRHQCPTGCPVPADNSRLVGFEISFTYTSSGGNYPTIAYLGGATNSAACDDPQCGTDFQNCFFGCTSRHEGCPVHLNVSGSEPGSAALYLNNGAYDQDAPFTPFSFSFNLGGLNNTPSPWQAIGCDVEANLADGMNNALCRPSPEGSWFFSLMTNGRSTVNDDSTAVPCGIGSPIVRCTNSRASASLFIDGMMLTAGEGVYLAPVFDSLSPRTNWKWLGWDVNLNVDAVDVRTPVIFKWRVANDTAGWTSSAIFSSPAFDGAYMPTQTEENLGNTLLAGTQGQYFQYQAELIHWDQNDGSYFNHQPPPKYANEPNCPAPTNQCYRSCLRYSMEYDGSLIPEIKRFQVCYEPDAGQFISAPIRPARLRGWSRLTYEADEAGGLITVAVVDDLNRPLPGFANVLSGDSLAGIDPSQYPSVKIKFRLDKLGKAVDPCVNWFKVEYEPMEECLTLNRNVIRLSRGERVIVRFCTERDGVVEVKIHDAAGQLIRKLFLSEIQAGKVFQKSWDGRSSLDTAVAPGVYFVTAVTPSGRKTARLAVAH